MANHLTHRSHSNTTRLYILGQLRSFVGVFFVDFAGFCGARFCDMFCVCDISVLLKREFQSILYFKEKLIPFSFIDSVRVGL